jgi:hypothetical protein
MTPEQVEGSRAPIREEYTFMRNGFALLVAGALFLSPMLVESLVGQAGQGQQPAAQGPTQGGGQGAQGVVGGVTQPQGGRQGGGAGRGGRGGRAAGPPPAPAPRNAAGRVIFSSGNPKQPILWTANLSIRETPLPRDQVPFQPWAKALFDEREKHELEPHARCKASGMTRQFLTPYGTEFVERTELQRIYIFDVGGPHTFRTIYMDGRSHPKSPTPSYYGHSIGWWEGDTLVVDTVGFNESFWWDRRGLPHTEQLHFVERFTRTDAQNMRYEFTVDDPGAYTKPYSGSLNIRASTGTELFEYICQQANYAHELMVGQAESVSRSTVTVP